MEIHRPDAITLAAQPKRDCAKEPEEWRRREKHHAVTTSREHERDEDAQIERSVVDESAEMLAASERRGAYSANEDTVARLCVRYGQLSSEIPAATREDLDVESVARQMLREIGQMLTGGRQVRVIMLIDEENGRHLSWCGFIVA